ncbi:MAG: bifunctional riboflavin kinase/FAD synthetase [Sphingobacteriales bacterium]|nr:bifunctional riboflavin kinase/FAD synthetase [Sphingobacteriales bacterium]
MKVHTHINELPVFHKAVITIGSFDGVHCGHQQIIRQLKSEAAAIGGESVLISFHPHPKLIVANAGHEINLLNTLEEKTDLLSRLGIDHLVVVPFTSEFANQSADDYIGNFLVANFHPHTIIIGHDHRFGNERKGDYQLLESRAKEYGYEVKEIPEHVLKNIGISSTKIRAALSQSAVDKANEFLGYAYFFSGKVIMGNQLGRTIGYPTANIEISDQHKLIPGNGVYAVEVEIPETKHATRVFKGMMNIGVRPTVGGTTRMIEVNIFDFDEMIYGEKLIITVLQQLRQEIKFNGLDALKAQLALDKAAAIAALDA